MPTLLDRIQTGMVTGVALWIGGTGCSTPLKTDMASDAASDTGAGLQPYPLDVLGCDSGDAGLGGYCCHSVACVTLGTSECPAVGDPAVANYAYGQPGCEASGPFAPNPDDPNPPAPAGECCYIGGSVAVPGRPLWVDQAAIVAPIVTRVDWLLG